MTSLGARIDARRRKRHRIYWAIGLPLVALLAFLVAAVISYGEYQEWPWSTYPTFLQYCGRQFQPAGGEVTRADLPAGVHKIDDLPGWLNSGEIWNDEPCRHPDNLDGVWVRGDNGRFKGYGLIGGL